MNPHTALSSLTPRQKEVLDLIIQHINTSGLPPTRKEISDILGFRSANAAEDHLRALERKGIIELIPGTSRGVRLLLETKESGLPLIGQVAAGNPILAEAHVEEYVQIDPNLFSQTADYLLRVKGQSMKDVGILDGDLLAVKNAKSANQGQIVVARIQDEVTVKRFFKNKNSIRLVAENPDFEDIIVNANEDFSIEGLAVGVIRRGGF